MTNPLRIAIVGHGNLGRGVEAALLKTADAELVGIYTRRDPTALSPVTPGATELRSRPSAPKSATVTGSNFFQRHRIGLVARVATAPLLRHQHAEKTQLRHFVYGLAREAMLLVPLGGKGLEAFLGKLPCCFAYL